MNTGGGSEDDKTVLATMQDEIIKLRAKMMELETNQSTLLARLAELDAKPLSVGNAETSEPAVATEAALIAMEETTDNDDALAGGTVHKPGSVEPCANAANASMTN